MSTVTFQVPEISCDHCKTAIESEVSGLESIESVTVLVNDKAVRVTGDVDVLEVTEAIAKAGYRVA